MKTSVWPKLCVAALMGAGIGPLANAGLFTDNFEMVAVAETSNGAPQNLTSPTTYCAIDGGYIEAGDSIAGDSAPTPDQVRQELFDALRSQGFQADTASPNLLLTYYWGVIRRDREEIRRPYGVKYNQDARIRLVSTQMLSSEVENHILGRQKSGGMDMNASSPELLVGPTATVVQEARMPRIFVIVSAFDYQGLTQRHEMMPIWRVKLSAQETAGDMDEVIPALLEKGATFFGKNLAQPKIVQNTLSKSGAASTPASAIQPAAGSSVDNSAVQEILRREHIEFSGENPHG